MLVGPYEITGELGKGGMGAVYRAIDRRMGREVALKVMLSPTPSKLAIQRFVREVQLAAQASGHPGIVGIHHAGAFPDGRLYYVMEMVRGRSLQEIIEERGPLPPETATRYVAEACEAVQFAHDRGVVHRDIAPKNILIDASDRPRILDFGLAKPVSDASRLTATNALLGTPLFMAPEQAHGAHAAGPAADIYALGATLYAGLSGRPPFREGPVMQVLRQVVEDDPEPLPETVPAPLRAIVAKALEKDPARRYPTAAALARDLQAFRRGESVEARPRARRSRRLRISPVIVLSAASLVFLAVTALVLFHGGDPPAPPPSGTEAAASGERPTPAPGDPPRSGYAPHVGEAVATLGDADLVGTELACTFRALLPDRRGTPPDPASPFPRAAAAWNERLRALLASGNLEGALAPDRDARAARIDRVLATLDEAFRGDPGATFPVWAAAHAAMGHDGRVLGAFDEVRPGPEGCLVVARLRLLRNEPDLAVAALSDIPGDEARLLCGLAFLLRPDIERARDELDRVEDRGLAAEAALPRAIIARLIPGRGADSSLAEVISLGADEADVRIGQGSDRTEALRILDRGLAAAHGDAPDLSIARAYALLDDDRFAEAIEEIRSARARHPDDPRLADAYAGVAYAAIAAATDWGRVTDRFRGPAADAAAAALAAGGPSIGDLADEARPRVEDGSPAPALLVALAREPSPHGATSRLGIEELARGIRSLDPGLAGRLLDGALRRLVGAGGARPSDEAIPSVLRLGRASLWVEPGAAPAILVAALVTRFEQDVYGIGPPPGWSENRTEILQAVGLLEERALAGGLDPPILLGCAEAMLDAADEDAGRRARYLRRALALLDALGSNLRGSPTPEATLLRARCLLALGDGDAAAEEARSAIREFGVVPLIARPSPAFLEDAARILDAALPAGAENPARVFIEDMRTVDVEGARASLLAAFERRDDRSMAALADTVLPMVPVDDWPFLVRLPAAYVAVDRPFHGVIFSSRLLRIGRWSRTSQVAFDVSGNLYGGVLGALRVHPPAEDLDGSIGLAWLRICDPAATPEGLIRGTGVATDLLAFGVAPGPLLTFRAYARLRLGDFRGAAADAAAASLAHVPLVVPAGVPQGAADEEYARLARLIEALAAARLGEDARVERALEGIADRNWMQQIFASTHIVGKDLCRIARAHPRLREYLGPLALDELGP